MTSIKRALVLATAGGYATSLVTVGTTAVVSRLIVPHEFGIAAIGLAIFAISEAVREVSSTAYIVQRPTLSEERLRTVFTINLITTAVLAIAITLSAPLLASALVMPGLDTFLHVCIWALFAGTMHLPLHGLLARDLEFGTIAGINVASSIANATTLIALAALNYSFLSFAFANVVSSMVTAALFLYFRPQFSIFRLRMDGWRHILSFGAYTSGTGLVHRVAEYATLLILAKILTPTAVGLLHRASLVCSFPERTLLAGVNAIALAGFSEQVRRKEDLASSYLAAVQRLTVLVWPALTLMILIAQPLILLYLGSGWLEVVPLVQIIAGALLLNINPGINYPLIIASGATHRALYLALVQVCVSLSIVVSAAPYGLEAVAWSAFAVVAANVATSTLVVRSIVPFALHRLCQVMWSSGCVTFFALAGPLAAVLYVGGPEQIGVVGAVAIVCATALGWLAGLWLVRHPLWEEVLWALSSVLKRLPVQWRIFR